MKDYLKDYLANGVTLFRILGGLALGFWLALYPVNTFFQQIWILRFFLILVITDFIDGWLVRSGFGEESNLGKILDPVADKLLFLIYLPLIGMGVISPLPIIILMARDILVDNLLRNYASSKGLVIKARPTGKVKTVIAFSLAGILLCRLPVSDMPMSGFDAGIISWIQSWPDLVVSGLIWSLIAIVIISGVDYFISNRQVLFED